MLLKKNREKIPVPVAHNKRGLYRDVMESLEIEDSFDVPLLNKTGTIYAAAYRKGILISISVVTDEKTKKTVRRVWRTK
jgi:hypothetical protein